MPLQKPLSWNEIKSRAITFSKDWEDERSEDAEAKTFRDGFFSVFGMTRRRLANFEYEFDRAVDSAYGKRSFATSADRMNFPFDLYQGVCRAVVFTWFLG